jgi:poly-gamma-glutamate capsule biosynthesis protein CapA/YwtB (metallophosphatase superfamily)
MLGRGVAERLEHGRPEELWSEELLGEARSCDLLVVNLECCISRRGQPTRLMRGKPFFFRSPPPAVQALQALGADVATLANNHALDYGEDALADTLELLVAAGVATAGAGRDAEAARGGALVASDGMRLGIVAVSDHPVQFAAGSRRPGIAHAALERGAPRWLADEIARLRERAERVIAFLHWGPNMTVRPAGWQRKLAAELLDAGADLVAGHSAHCFHGVELAEAGPVLYDLGDALDDYAVDPELRNDLGVLALWRPARGAEIELVGLKLEYCYTELASGQDAEWIASRLARACDELGSSVERLDEQRFRVSPA